MFFYNLWYFKYQQNFKFYYEFYWMLWSQKFKLKAFSIRISLGVYFFFGKFKSLLYLYLLCLLTQVNSLSLAGKSEG